MFKMAASGSTAKGGYDCELFLSPVPEELKCGLCKQVARESNLASCCGEHFCKLCIEQIIRDKKPCPSCEEAEFTINPDKRDSKKILALEVQCTLKDRGCDWTGTLEQLDAHLDVNSDNCQYVDVKCPNKCEQPVHKCHLPTHLTNECTKRDFCCQYCKFKATYEVVCNDHWPQCPFYPVPCPNSCETLAIERGDLDAHLKLCPLEVVECDFSYVDCNVKLTREEMEKHLADNLQRHVLMMNKTLQEKIEEKERKIEQLEAKLEEKTQEVRKDKDKQIQEHVREREHQIQELREEKNKEVQKQEQQLQELRDESERKIQELHEENDKKIQEQVQERERQIKELREQNDRQVQKLREENDRKIQEQAREREQLRQDKDRQNQELQEMQVKITQVEAQLVAVLVNKRCGIAQFAISGFQEMKGCNSHWDSPPLYTHPGGYKIGIRVYPNGHGVAYDTHLTVYMCRAISKNDAQLKWPADCTITLQLLNQHRDQDHVTVIKQFQWDKPTGMDLLSFESFSNLRFIAHEDLDWNAEKQTQYLKDDSLQFRISIMQDCPVH